VTALRQSPNSATPMENTLPLGAPPRSDGGSRNARVFSRRRPMENRSRARHDTNDSNKASKCRGTLNLLGLVAPEVIAKHVSSRVMITARMEERCRNEPGGMVRGFYGRSVETKLRSRKRKVAVREKLAPLATLRALVAYGSSWE